MLSSTDRCLAGYIFSENADYCPLQIARLSRFPGYFKSLLNNTSLNVDSVSELYGQTHILTVPQGSVRHREDELFLKGRTPQYDRVDNHLWDIHKLFFFQ